MNKKQKRLFMLTRLKSCGAWRRQVAIGKVIEKEMRNAIPKYCDIQLVSISQVDFVDNAFRR